MVSKYDYSVTPGDRLGRPLAMELAALFSSAYGKWSRKSPVNPGGRIRLGAGYYLANYANPLFRVATCRAGSRLIAQAVYLECDTPRGKVSLVVQLVEECAPAASEAPDDLIIHPRLMHAPDLASICIAAPRSHHIRDDHFNVFIFHGYILCHCKVIR